MSQFNAKILHRPSSSHSIFGCILLGLSICVIAGCGAESSLESERTRLVLNDKPDGSTTIAEALASAEDAEGKVDVTIVGRISAGEQDPFSDGEASFILSEAPLGDHANDPGHDVDDCPFCSQHAKDGPVAFVQFVTDSGSIIEHDARELFEIEKGKIVVITGTARFSQQLDKLAVTASGIHVVN